MKVCAGCLGELPKEMFSNRQWQMQQYQRRCKGCIDADQPVQLEPPPKDEPNRDVQDEPSPPPVADGEEATCWFCHGPDEPGQPLRRDCSCRGSDAGFAHLSCLVGYAKHENENWDGKDIDKFREPWVYCLNCRQEYQNALSLELAAEFVAFVEKNYPGDQTKLVEALSYKMWDMMESDPGEAKEAGHKILSAIDQMKAATHLLSPRTISVEIVTHNRLGAVYLEEGTEESAKAAIEHFERFRDLCIELEYPAGFLAMAEGNLARAKRECEGDSCESIEEILKRSQAVYDSFVAVEPEGQPSMQAGLNLADALHRANRANEAETFLAQLVATCERVHGSDHSLTMEVKRNVRARKLSGDAKE